MSSLKSQLNAIKSDVKANLLDQLAEMTADDLDSLALKGENRLLEIAFSDDLKLPKLAGGWTARLSGARTPGKNVRIVIEPNTNWTNKLVKRGIVARCLAEGMTELQAGTFLCWGNRFKIEFIVHIARLLKNPKKRDAYIELTESAQLTGDEFDKWLSRMGLSDTTRVDRVYDQAGILRDLYDPSEAVVTRAKQALESIRENTENVAPKKPVKKEHKPRVAEKPVEEPKVKGPVVKKELTEEQIQTRRNRNQRRNARRAARKAEQRQDRADALVTEAINDGMGDEAMAHSDMIDYSLKVFSALDAVWEIVGSRTELSPLEFAEAFEEALKERVEDVVEFTASVDNGAFFGSFNTGGEPFNFSYTFAVEDLRSDSDLPAVHAVNADPSPNALDGKITEVPVVDTKIDLNGNHPEWTDASGVAVEIPSAENEPEQGEVKNLNDAIVADPKQPKAEKEPDLTPKPRRVVVRKAKPKLD